MSKKKSSGGTDKKSKSGGGTKKKRNPKPSGKKRSDAAARPAPDAAGPDASVAPEAVTASPVPPVSREPAAGSGGVATVDPGTATQDVESLAARLEAIADPLERFGLASAELARHQRAIERLSAVRAEAVAGAHRSGESVRALARRFGVSPSRIHQLVRDAEPRTDVRPEP
jgi:hypothetical protein